MSGKCSACNVEFVSGDIVAKCAECGAPFHPACTRAGSAQNFTKLKSRSWRCDVCKDKFFRYKTHFYRGDNFNEGRNQLKGLKVKGRIRGITMLTCCMVHKILSHKEPRYLSERLLFREEVSQRSTRHGYLLNFRRVRYEVGRRSFSYFGPKLYNDLPLSLKECSCSTFKRKLKDFLIVDN
ncbi:hypothetical protein J6590_084858 [Homalodisca vitripennis]|nr:hypothetical protein J6590_084858 [Homalodisca vitripennis]